MVSQLLLWRARMCSSSLFLSIFVLFCTRIAGQVWLFRVDLLVAQPYRLRLRRNLVVEQEPSTENAESAEYVQIDEFNCVRLTESPLRLVICVYWFEAQR